MMPITQPGIVGVYIDETGYQSHFSSCVEYIYILYTYSSWQTKSNAGLHSTLVLHN